MLGLTEPPPPLAPTGWGGTAASATRIDLKWTDNSADETQFTVERSTDNVSFAQATTLGVNSISYADTAVVPGTTYYYRVNGRRTDATSAYSNTASATPPVAPVVSGAWRSQDVGAVGVPGSVTESGASSQLAGSGADIWETADAFRFRHQAWTGDGELVVRVSSLTYTNAWAKAGVMFRESTDAGSRNVFLAVTPGNGVAFQSRTRAYGATRRLRGYLTRQRPAQHRGVHQHGCAVMRSPRSIQGGGLFSIRLAEFGRHETNPQT